MNKYGKLEEKGSENLEVFKARMFQAIANELAYGNKLKAYGNKLKALEINLKVTLNRKELGEELHYYRGELEE